MNYIRFIYLISAVFIIGFLTQCNSVSDVPEEIPKSKESLSKTELITPMGGATEQSVEMEFKWKEVETAESYHLMLSDTSSFTTTEIDTILTKTNHTVDSLNKGTTYFWKVKSINVEEVAPWSEVWDFSTAEKEVEPVSVALVAPENGEEITPVETEFKWEIVSGAKTYLYQLSETADFEVPEVDSLVTSNVVSIDNLKEGKEYHWRVAPVLEKETGKWSDAWKIKTAEGNPESVDVMLTAPENGEEVETSAEFTWEATGEADNFQYQLSTTENFETPEVDSLTSANAVRIDDLKEGTEYFWRVAPVLNDKREGWSETSFFSVATEQTTEPPKTSGDFVEVQNANFVMNGEVLNFSGTNAYYLPNYEKLNSAVVDRAFDIFEETGITVVRMWGFYDGYDCGYSRSDSNENVIQTAPGEYSEEALRDLDRVIAKGKEHGVKFIIPFINYWDELGGVCQYNTWAGASNPSTNMDFFMNNEQTQKWYKDYIEMLLNRVNTETGVAYKNEPAILGWQIMNEGRNSGKDATILRDWYQEIAQYIKDIDPNHLLSTGEEGFDEGTPSEYSEAEYSNTYTLRAQEGTSYVLNTAIPEIDFGNAHWYPTEYGFGDEVDEGFLRAQQAWLKDHKDIAEASGKPFIIGEYGYPGWGDERVDGMYNAFYEQSESMQLDGDLLWQLTADGTKCWEFGGNICYPAGREDVELYGKFKDHVNNMDALN